MKRKDFKILVVGDCILNQNMQDDEELLKITSNADLCIGNFESLIHNFEFPPEKYDGQGAPMQSPPEIINVLKSYNLKLISHANNHSNDYGIGGLTNSINYLKNSGITIAGVGPNEKEAFTPAFIKKNNTSIGLISSTTTYSKWAIATPNNSKVKGKPGVNYLILKPNFLLYVSKGIRLLLKKFGLDKLLIMFTFGDYIIPKSEFKKVYKQITHAKEKKDFLIYSLHSHQGLSNKPPKAIKKIAKFCIDNGVDVFFSHGTHELRGIEIYKRKPIFYGLGNFFAQSQDIKAFPTDFILSKGLKPNAPEHKIMKEVAKVILKKPQWWYSIAAKITVNESFEIKKIEIIPIDLSDKNNLGWPKLADKRKRKVITHKVEKLSRKFRTSIIYNNENIEVKI